MKKIKFIQALKSLLPIPIFFIFSIILSEYLIKFGITGPINSHGQPIFYPNYCNIIYYSLLTIIALGLIYSLFQLKKIKGWLKYALLIFIVLLLPIQFLFTLATLTSIFGK
jgi:hypothetical protein